MRSPSGPGTRAGAGATTRARQLVAQGIFTLLAGLAVGAASLQPAENGPNLALAAVAAALLLLAVMRLRRAQTWRIGARGERQVAKRLRLLRRRGWLIAHDVMKDCGGNLDHPAAGRGGVFTIETKLTRSGPQEIAQARAHARWAANTLNVPVIPVLCVVNRDHRPTQRDGVWIVGSYRLVHFLERQRGGPADLPALQRALSHSATTPPQRAQRVPMPARGSPPR